MNLPDSWIVARLADICVLNPRLPTDARPDEMTEVTFVPMSAVDEKSGTISKPEMRTYREVSKGYTSFLENDVLFAKVTPCMENGKAAIAGALANGLGFGSTEFHVLRPTRFVLPEYIFHFIRQEAFRDRAASAFVGTGGLQRVPPEFLSRIKLPLPTLPEQQRIIDVLRQAEAATQLQGTLNELLFKIKHQLFVEMFGDPNPKHNTTWPIVKLGSLVTVATGGTPSREQADSYVGKIAWAKSTDLTDEAISSTEETITALGVQRSNAKVHPKHTILLAMYGQGQTRGRTAKLLIDAACNQACAALLPSAELLPDYLWVWLQLSYDSVRSLGRGGQQENLNLDIVRSLKLPKPPLALQQEFARRLDQLLEVDVKSRMARRQAVTLLKALSIEALTGTITERWRGQHSAEIAAAAATRDARLRERGAKFTSRPVETVPLAPVAKDSQRPVRQWLIAELSEFQRQVLAAFSTYPEQPLLVEDADVFARFCDDESVLELLKDFGPSLNNRIRRTLSQLSSLGLIAKLTLPKKNTETSEREYLKAFRPLRSSEYTKQDDVETIRRAMLTFYFTVTLDYETSQHAGAGGMFQVADMRDEKDVSRTDLVDQGKHYSTLKELARDLARRLRVSENQIVLEE